MAAFDDNEEKLCRYCFGDETDGPLISPCQCSGGQKYVHLDCLRRWQRMVIVNQPTHPAYYEDDVRHHKCNVCLSDYTCPPPTRGELMETFTGPEIAASLFEGRIIASRDIFSESLERQVADFPPYLRLISSYEHWIRGVYLITSVESDDEEKVIPITEPESLDGLMSRLDDNLEMTFHGQHLRLVRGGSLASVREDEDLRAALQSLQLPARIVLRSTAPITCADDHITAVNIARTVDRPVRPGMYHQVYEEVRQRYRSLSRVEVVHYIGGPVDANEVTTCIVLGGARRGWTVVKDLKDALTLAVSRGYKRHDGQGEVCSGQTVRVTGLVARADLNGRIGMALRFLPEAGRWEVQLCTGEGIRVKPSNLEGQGGGHGKVMVFWGDARWSRAQLLVCMSSNCYVVVSNTGVFCKCNHRVRLLEATGVCVEPR
mmetsp:Transcript_4766/g.7234  ORF Transcript_4766/g.7234 Transcript_4766/m.7234 type:complete len:431 (+) Transcript_4766:101-1393(+)